MLIQPECTKKSLAYYKSKQVWETVLSSSSSCFSGRTQFKRHAHFYSTPAHLGCILQNCFSFPICNGREIYDDVHMKSLVSQIFVLVQFNDLIEPFFTIGILLQWKNSLFWSAEANFSI